MINDGWHRAKVEDPFTLRREDHGLMISCSLLIEKEKCSFNGLGYILGHEMIIKFLDLFGSPTFEDIDVSHVDVFVKDGLIHKIRNYKNGNKIVLDFRTEEIKVES